MSRSVTVAVVYIMCVTSLNWRDSLKVVQGARTVANPNVGFLKQIQEFEKDKLQDERQRMKDKFPDTSLVLEDEKTAKELLALYYHFLNIGEMCDGNCPMGQTCPRGICHQNRTTGIFRQNSREISYSKSTSVTRRASRSPSNTSRSPEPFPHSSRNQSPSRTVDYKSEANNLTPPTSPCRPRLSREGSYCSIQSRNENRSPDVSPSKSSTTFCGQMTSPGSPYRSFGYYTSSAASNNGAGQTSGSMVGSPSRSFRSGKVVFSPSSSPASPTNSNLRKRGSNASISSSSSPSSSPSTPRKKRPQPHPFSEIQSTTNTGKSPQKYSSLSPKVSKTTEESLFPRNSLERSRAYAKSLLYRHKAKFGRKDSPQVGSSSSVDKSGGYNIENRPSNVDTKMEDLPKSPKSSRFYQAVTRLLPQINSMSASSKVPRYSPKSSSMKHRSLSPREGGSKIVIFELCKDFQGFQDTNKENKALMYKDMLQNTSSEIKWTKSDTSETHLKSPETTEETYMSKKIYADFDYVTSKNGYFTAIKDDLLYVETPASHSTCNDKGPNSSTMFQDQSFQEPIASCSDNIPCLICSQTMCDHFRDLKRSSCASNDVVSPSGSNLNNESYNLDAKINQTLPTLDQPESKNSFICRPLQLTPPPIPPRRRFQETSSRSPPVPPRTSRPPNQRTH